MSAPEPVPPADRWDSPRAAALRTALEVSLLSRLLVVGVAIYASRALTFDATARQDLLPDGRRSGVLYPFTENPLRHVAELVFSPLARWDAGWYLGLAQGGYDDGPGTAFFPLYPFLTWVVSGAAQTPALVMIAAYLVSFVAFAVGLYVLHRLVELEFGREYARPALLLIAFFPGALYFGAPYSESLFLLVSVSAFYAARTGHWALAGLLAGAASGTRSVGILLVVPLAVLYLYGPREDRLPDRASRGLRPRYRLGPNVLFLGLAPAGLLAFTVYLAIRVDDPFAWVTVQETFWGRSTGFPFEQVWTGTAAAATALGRLLGGYREGQVPGYPLDYGGLYVENLALFGFLVFALVAQVGTMRRLPAAYGAWSFVALGVPLSYSIEIQPLLAFQRYVAVAFPLFIWLALTAVDHRLLSRLLPGSAILLGLFTAQFATWHWFV